MTKIEKNQNEDKFIKGELIQEIYHHEEESFTIAKISIVETNLSKLEEKTIVIKGYFPSLQKEKTYLFYGKTELHKRFGMQFNVEKFETYIPTSEEGLIDYLSSELFYGIGPVTARNIVKHLGVHAIEKILQDENILDEVPKLTEENKKVIVESLQLHQGFEKVLSYLQSYKIGLKIAQKIYSQYKEESIEIIDTDPYQLVYEIDGFGFQTADDIAMKNGLKEDHPNRIGAASIYVLQRSLSEGHVYLPIDLLIDRILTVLQSSNLNFETVSNIIHHLNEEEIIKLDDKRVYLPRLHHAEVGVQTELERILSFEETNQVDTASLFKIIGDIEEREKIQYGKEQFQAIQKAIKSKVMILTGGPGTGKTTVVKGIIETFKKVHKIKDDHTNNDHFLLAAPTGRAAKRLEETTNIKAMTIHRLLGWDGVDGFSKNREEKLEGKMLIVDEFSMVDISLAYQLFMAVPKDMYVLIVGDEDQLPSVGPGYVLKDLLESKRIPSVHLKEVYRQKEDSKIIRLAHLIKNDELTKKDLNNGHDFSFIPCDTKHLLDAVLTIYSRALEKGIDPEDFQVLVPIYRTKNGINEMNKHLQKLVNPPTENKREVSYQDIIFRIGDKVLQLTNQPEDGIYNGDIGKIVAIFRPKENKDKKEQLVVQFDEKEVVYERKEYKNLQHAYCISIHKSQGSEFKNVLLPITSSYYRMLKKNLIYTAITRGEDSLTICGDVNTFLRSVHSKSDDKRFTYLQNRLSNKEDIFQNSEELLPIHKPLTEKEKKEDKNLSPYDFM